jgi:hypothetical protein
MFDDFTKLLIEKFGQPSHQGSSKMGVRGQDKEKTSAWSFPSTKIELTYITMLPIATYLVIRYSDKSSSKGTLDKL